MRLLLEKTMAGCGLAPRELRLTMINVRKIKGKELDLTEMKKARVVKGKITG